MIWVINLFQFQQLKELIIMLTIVKKIVFGQLLKNKLQIEGIISISLIRVKSILFILFVSYYSLNIVPFIGDYVEPHCLHKITLKKISFSSGSGFCPV